MKSSIIAALGILFGTAVAYAGGPALDSLKGYGPAELTTPQARAEAVLTKDAAAPAQAGEQPVSIRVLRASGVSGKITDGRSKRKATTCQVTRYEYRDSIGFVLQSYAYNYTFPFTVKKTFLPLDRKVVLGEDNDLDSYTFKPDLLGNNGQLFS